VAAAKTKKDWALIPAAFHAQLEECDEGRALDDGAAARVAADVVSGFSDGQAAAMYSRLTGASMGSVSDLISH
jgi:hypothetical protein